MMRRPSSRTVPVRRVPSAARATGADSRSRATPPGWSSSSVSPACTSVAAPSPRVTVKVRSSTGGGLFR
ncbi:MAG: hypothetical protein IPJ65_14065 [Archangiaceae bacterium]|nr:hypothetical protein [Archangiaceae bacterium]